jgi:hypothetical protein
MMPTFVWVIQWRFWQRVNAGKVLRNELQWRQTVSVLAEVEAGCGQIRYAYRNGIEEGHGLKKQAA